MKNGISTSELEIMQILWTNNAPMTVQNVCDKLPSGKWAYKTVATLLVRMEEKGAAVSHKEGRTNVYTPVLDKDEYTRENTRDFISRLYNGSAKELVASLFKSGDMTEKDIEELRREFNL